MPWSTHDGGNICNMKTYTCDSNWNTRAGPVDGFSGAYSVPCAAHDNTRCGNANQRFTYVDGNGNTVSHMAGPGFPHWTGCGFRNNSGGFFASNTTITSIPEPPTESRSRSVSLESR